jgi:hypothetical protein
MRKTRVKEKSKNLHLAFYFVLVVAFIIIVSFAFKIFDTIKSSRFDASNFFTLAIIDKKNTKLISVSPKDGTLKELIVTDAKSEKDLDNDGIPFDKIAKTGELAEGGPKSFFTKILLRKDSLKSNLTVIDLIKLTLYAQKVGGDNVSQNSVSAKDSPDFSQLTSQWFIDPAISKENLNIEITNATDTAGLGNKFAKVVGNMGGNVVLVNNSQNVESKSKIYYKNDSYTVKKISKLLGIPVEKKSINSISDIVIQIGHDKEDF